MEQAVFQIYEETAIDGKNPLVHFCAERFPTTQARLDDLDIEELIAMLNSGDYVFPAEHSFLKFMDIQPERLCFAAVKHDFRHLQYVKSQSDRLCLDAVRQNGLALEYVERQTVYLCYEAYKNDKKSVEYVREPLLGGVIEDAFNFNPNTTLDNISEEYLTKLHTNLISLSDLLTIPYSKTGYSGDNRIIYNAVHEFADVKYKRAVGDMQVQCADGALDYFAELERLSSDGLYLKNIEYQTPGLCLCAVQHDGTALLFVKEQTMDLCVEAVKNDVTAVKYVKSDRLRQYIHNVVTHIGKTSGGVPNLAELMESTYGKDFDYNRPILTDPSGIPALPKPPVVTQTQPQLPSIGRSKGTKKLSLS